MARNLYTQSVRESSCRHQDEDDRLCAIFPPGPCQPAIFSFFIFIAGGLKVGPVRRQLLAYQEPSRKKETDVGLLDQRSEEEPGHRPEHQIVKEKRKGAQGLDRPCSENQEDAIAQDTTACSLVHFGLKAQQEGSGRQAVSVPGTREKER